jgi:hypothetical protein
LIKNQTLFHAELWCTSRKSNECKQFSENLIDISSRGLSFRSDLADDIFLPGMFLDKIKIFSHDDCLLQTSGEVKHIYYDPTDAERPYYKVGVEFEAGFADEERRYKTGLRKQQEGITNPALIFENLKKVIENRALVSLKDVEYPSYQAITGHFTQLADSTRFYTLTFEPASQVPGDQLFEELDRVQAKYQLNADGYQFVSIIISRDQNRVVLKLPKSITRCWRRNTLRYVPPLADSLKLRITHPLLDSEFACRVLDLTPGGLSVAVESPDDLFIKGMFIPRATLIIPGEEPIITSAQVKYVSRVADEQGGNRFKCGLGFVDLSVREADFLVSYLLNKCYPHLKDARGESLEDIWGLFYESGFIYEDKRKFLAPVTTEINDTFKKLLESDTRFYKKIILKEGDRCCGTVSGIWAYEHTWVVQHLATVKHSREFISKDLIISIADFCAKHPDVIYQKLFWRKNNSWSDKAFGRYARLVADRSDLSHLICYDYLIKSPLDDCPEMTLPAGVVIEPLAENERPLIESYFIARREYLMLQTDSLLREEIALPHIRQMYRQKGLERHRQIYIAKSGRSFLGFVLIEDSSLGLNLSGLLNHFKVYTSPECGEMENGVKRGLIQKAVEYYEQRGRRFAICLAANEKLEVYEALGFTRQKEYMCWTLNQKLIQPWIGYITNFSSVLKKGWPEREKLWLLRFMSR